MVAYASASSFQGSFTCKIWRNAKGKETQKKSWYEQSRELLIYCFLWFSIYFRVVEVEMQAGNMGEGYQSSQFILFNTFKLLFCICL